MGDLNKWWCVHSGGLEDEVHLMRLHADPMKHISEARASGEEEAFAAAAPAATASTLSLVKAILTKTMKLPSQGGPTSGMTCKKCLFTIVNMSWKPALHLSNLAV